jgi:hypothetical protein
MIKLQASLTDRGVVDDLQETGGIGHQRAVEQDLVDLQKSSDRCSVPGRGLLLELPEDPGKLSVDGLGDVGHEAH